jgi:predicted nuclease with TOPRIM domain
MAVRAFFLWLANGVRSEAYSKVMDEFISLSNKTVCQYSSIRERLNEIEERFEGILEENRQLQQLNAKLAMQLTLKEIQGK